MPPLPAPLVLVVEDDPKTSQLLAVYLQREGYETIAAFDGRHAVELFHDRQPQFVVLDVMLPLLDGWEVCREIRRRHETPMLFLTARDEESDRLLGLGLGADDYVVKPFSPREVVARVKSILRRVERSRQPLLDLLSHDTLLLDRQRRRVSLDGIPVTLTPLEYTLLVTLMSSPGRVFLRAELLDRMYPRGEVVVDRVVDVHIGKLRQKIEQDPTAPSLILTVRGTGYRFADGEGGP